MTSGLQPNQWVAITVALLACAFDLRTRRIPNPLTFGAAALGLCYAGLTGGPWGLATSVGGWCTGCGLFLPFFLLRGLGAGDVKLAAAVGAWMAPGEALWMALYAMIAGGVMAILMALATGYLRTAVDNLYVLLAHFRVTGVQPHPDLTLERGKGPRLPYAFPIAAGTIAVIWLH